MIKILLTSALFPAYNRGSAAIVLSASQILRRYIPDSEITVFSKCSRLYSSVYKDDQPRVVQFSGGNLLRENIDTEIVIDVSGDSFSDEFLGRLNAPIGSMQTLFNVSSACLMGKPFLFYSQSIGPFKTKLTKWLAKLALMRANLVIPREELTVNYLRLIGLNIPLYMFPDCAFVLKAATRERINAIKIKEGINQLDHPIIGISISQHIDKLFSSGNPNSHNHYVAVMAKVLDYVMERIKASIILVPHVTIPNPGSYDDRFVAQKVYHRTRNKPRIRIINGEYGPQELKGIIGLCDIFLGARMHACISALSMHVPTIAISYSNKAPGIMSMLGQHSKVCDYRTMTFHRLKFMIEGVWSDKDDISNNLITRMRFIKRKVNESGILLYQSLSSVGAL